MITFDLNLQTGSQPGSIEQQVEEENHILPDFGVVAVEEACVSFPTMCGKSSTDSIDSSEMSKRLHRAKKQARWREMRLRIPTVAGGGLLGVVGVFVLVLMWHSTLPLLLGSFLAISGWTFGMLGILPSDRRAIIAVGWLSVLALLIVTLSSVLESRRFLKHLQNNECIGAAEGHLFPCWYTGFRGAIRMVDAFLVVAQIARMSFSILKKSSRASFFAIWSGYGFVFVGIGLNGVPKAVSAIVVGDRVITSVIITLRSLILGFFSLRGTHFRGRVQSWFMSRGQAAVTAAGVAQLVAGREIQDVLSTARSTFISVTGDCVYKEDMENNKPNPCLSRLAHKSRLGLVDAFLSHSWHDDPTLKWDALQKLRTNFKIKHQREPRLWIDKYSIDQNDIDNSLACLSVYLSGCRQLWILCGQTYLERLWCLIEVFVFLEMGGSFSDLRVVILGNRSDEVQTSNLEEKLRSFDPRRARCFTDYDTERLHAVIQTTGYARIVELVRKVFVVADDTLHCSEVVSP